MKLQQYMARAGVASRRKSEEIIRQGRVYVNGVRAELGLRVGPEDDVVLDGRPLLGAESFVYFAFNKPKAVLSTVKDDRGRKTIMDFYRGKKRIFPVGRLDYDSHGLILLTNDGDFAQLFIHPRYGLDKAYILELDRPLKELEIEKLSSGVLVDGYKTRPIKIRRLGARNYSFTLVEGRNRQIRKMVESLGRRVVDLKRVRVGPFELDDLAPGDFRPLKIRDVERLKNEISP